MTANITAADVKRLRLNPGDVVVLTTKVRITPDIHAEILAHVEPLFPHNKLLVVDGTAAEFSVLGPDTR